MQSVPYIAPKKWRSYEISSDRLSVFLFAPEFFSGIACRAFWFFLHEVRVLSNLKSDGAGFFKKKSCSGFFRQKGPKVKFFKNFPDFCMKLEQHKALKLEKSCFEVFMPKRAKMGRNWGFSNFVKNWLLGFFSNFLDMVLVSHQLVIKLNGYFGSSLVLMYLGQERLEMGLKWGFSGITKAQCMMKHLRFFCMKQQQREGLNLMQMINFRKNLF